MATIGAVKETAELYTLSEIFKLTSKIDNRKITQSRGKIMEELSSQEDFRNMLIDAFQDIEGPNEWIDGEDENVAENNDQFCNWYLRVWADCEAAEKRIKDQCEVMIKAVQARKMGLQYMKGYQFRQYIEAMIEADPKKRSINLAHGEAGFRKSPEKVVWEDEELVIKNAEKHLPEAVKIKKSLSKIIIKNSMKETGKLLSGCKIVPAVDHFYPQTEIHEKLEEIELQKYYKNKVKTYGSISAYRRNRYRHNLKEHKNE